MAVAEEGIGAPITEKLRVEPIWTARSEIKFGWGLKPGHQLSSLCRSLGAVSSVLVPLPWGVSSQGHKMETAAQILHSLTIDVLGEREHLFHRSSHKSAMGHIIIPPPVLVVQGKGNMMIGLGLNQMLSVWIRCLCLSPMNWNGRRDRSENGCHQERGEWMLRVRKQNLSNFLTVSKHVDELRRELQSLLLWVLLGLYQKNETNEARILNILFHCNLLKLCEAAKLNSCLVHGWYLRLTGSSYLGFVLEKNVLEPCCSKNGSQTICISVTWKLLSF